MHGLSGKIIQPALISEALRALQRHPQLRSPNPVFFHPFPARMPLSVAEFLINRLSLPGSVVLDPMVGSATTIIAAKKLGRIGVGFDLDPLAVMLSRAITMETDFEALETMGQQIWEGASRCLNQPHRLHQELTGFDEEGRSFLDFWFPRQSQDELLALAAAIQDCPEYQHRDLLWAVFSSLIIAKSSGASYAVDLSHSRPHRRLQKKIVSPLTLWSQKFRIALKTLRLYEKEKSVLPTTIARGDARSLELTDASVDFILTSPPYKQAIDYMRAHKFSLIWMGYHLKDLRNLRSGMIGAARGLSGPNGLPAHLENGLEKLDKPSDRGTTRRYLSDMQSVLREFARVLKPGGLAVLVVGPSVLSKTSPDSEYVFKTLAENSGLSLIAAVRRKLRDKHRGMPPPALLIKGNSLKKRMQYEVFLALRKG